MRNGDLKRWSDLFHHGSSLAFDCRVAGRASTTYHVQPYMTGRSVLPAFDCDHQQNKGHRTMANDTSLAERLGYRADDRLLIINCDDLGVSHAANVATFDAMANGVATSATLMVPCPWAREAAEMFAGLAIGVHLTLTSEYPNYRWGSLTGRASLHDDDGYFARTTVAAIERME